MKFIRIFLAFAIFSIVALLVNTFCLNTYNKIIIYHDGSLGNSARIYFTGSTDNKFFTEKFSRGLHSSKQDTSTYQSVVYLNNEVIKTLRIDPGVAPGEYTIYTIELHSFFGSPVILSPDNSNLLSSSDPFSMLSTFPDRWSLTSTGEDPYLILTGSFKTKNTYLLIIPALAWALFTYVLAKKTSFKETKVYYDSMNKSPSSGLNFAALDGLRGFAALLVIADHTGLPGFDNLAPEGVVLFFCLSGFLLSMPFATQPERGASIPYLRTYLLRRIKRILPMFYFVTIAGYFFEANLSDLVRSLLFIQGKGIKWTVLQELYFYLLLPILMFSCYKFFKGKSINCFLLLSALALLFNTGRVPTPPVYGLGESLPLYLGLFITGMAMCFLRHSEIIKRDSMIVKILGSRIVSISLLVLILFYKDLLEILPWTSAPSPLELYHSNFCLVVGVLIVVATLKRENLIIRAFRFYPLRLIGLVSYSMYLLHPIVHIVDKQIFTHYLGHNPGGIISFTLCLAITFILSIITYTYIERPFIRGSS